MEDQYLIDKNRYDEDVKNGIFPEKTLIEKQVWESTLNRSMVLEAENAQLKELLKECRIANETLVGIMDWLRQSVIPEQRECCEELFVKVQKLQTLIDEVLK